MGYFALPRVDKDAPLEEQSKQWIENAMDNLRLYKPGYDYLLGFAEYSIAQARRIDDEIKARP